MNRYRLALLALALTACGQKGPLYMPDGSQGEVVTRPTATNTADGTSTGPSNSPSTPDSPGRATTPAPEVTAPAPGAVDDKNDKTHQKNGAVPPPK